MSNINIESDFLLGNPVDKTKPKVKAKQMRPGKKCVWGDQLLGGFPGQKNTAPVIAEYIPQSRIYCEPFAGVGSVGDLIKPEFLKVFNDLSPEARRILKKKNQFNPYIHVSNLDFKACLKEWDAKDTFFLIDPPWNKGIYTNNRNTVQDHTVKRYYQVILYELLYIKANWILCSGIYGWGATLINRSAWFKKIVQGKKNSIFGYTPQVLLCSNLPFKRRNPLNSRLEEFG